MKKTFYPFIAVFLFFVGVGLFAAEIPPAWIDNPSSLYDSNLYITAVGNGKDRKSAEASAINALASIFGQSIDSKTNSSKSMEESTGQGQSSYQKRTNVSQDISLRAHISSLMNAEIKMTWSDKDGTCYALAIIDKENAAAYYSREIETLSSDISELISVQEDGSPLDLCMNYKTAIGLAEKQNEYMSMLTVLNGADAMLLEDKVFSANKLSGELSQIQKEVPINITVSGITGDWFNKIRKTLVSKLSDSGFKTTQKPSRYVLKCDVDIVNFKLEGNPNEMVKYFVQIVLVDTETDLELFPYSTEGQTGFKTLFGATDRAYMLIDKKIRAEYSFSDAN